MPIARPAAPHPLALDPASDEQVALQVTQGQRDRFEILMRRYNARVYRTARSILKNDAAAEDAAQEAWILAFRNLEQWEHRASFSTWLTRITANEALRRLGGERREGLRIVRDADVSRVPSTDNPEADAGRREVRRFLEQAIDALPDTLRVVYMLREIEDMSGGETAYALGLTEEAVRVRLHRARQSLQTRMSDEVDSAGRGAFPFLGARCNRIVANVLSRLNAEV